MQIARHKRGVLVLVRCCTWLHATNPCWRRHLVWCAIKRTERHQTLDEYALGLGSPRNLNTPYYKYEPKQAGYILGRDRRETTRQGGWRKEDWQGKVLVVLIF